MKQWLKKTLVLICAVALVACAGIALNGCKKKKGHTHSWDEGVVTTQATCTTQGEILYTCTKCDETKKETVAPSHFWTDEVTAPTCTSDGYTTHTCVNCGAERKDTYVKASAHSYEKTSHKATCTTDGYDEYECTVCGDSYSETTSKKTGHDTLNATWTTKGSDVRIDGCTYERTEVATCKTCGEQVEKSYEIQKHDYAMAITTFATCSAAGEKTYSCDCGESYTVEYAIVETAHDWEKGTTANGVTTYACKHNHNHTKTEIDLTATAEPTVTVSQENIASGAELKMNNATMKIDDTLKGKLTGDVQLTAGKFEQSDSTVSDAVDKLSAADKERLGDAPIFNFGLQSDGQDVDFDGGKITVSVPYELDTDEDPESIVIAWIKDDGTIELIPAAYANGFATFEAEHFSLYSVVRMTPEERCAKFGGCQTVDTVVAPTCEEDGYTLTTCKICHKISRKDFTKATGHDYEDKVTAPTCTSEGYTTRTCKHCDDSYATNYVAKKAHDYEKTIVAPTCTSEGYTKSVCKVCHDTVYDDYKNKFAHDYQNGACSACGAKDPSAVATEDVNLYLNMIQSVLDTDMSLYLEVKDINVNVTVPDVLFDEYMQELCKSQTYKVKLTGVKVFYALDENGNISAKGEMSMTVEGWYNRAQAGSSSSQKADFEMEAVSKFVVKDGGVYAYSKSAQSQGDESEEYEAYLYQPIDMGEMPSLEEIKELLAPVSAKAKIIIDKIYGIKNNPLDTLLAKITEYVFDKKATADGYVFTVNYDRFAEVYEAATKKSIDEVYDAIFGANAFDKTVTYLKGALNKTVKGVLSDFAKESVKAGVSIDDLYALVDAALALVPTENDQPMTVQQFLTAYGDLTIKSILDDMIPSEGEPVDYAAMIDSVGAQLKEMTIADAIGMLVDMIGGGSTDDVVQGDGSYMSETTQTPADPVKALLEEIAEMLNKTTMGFTTDKLGNVISLDLNLNIDQATIDLAKILGVEADASNGGTIDSTELKIDAKGTAKLTFGGSMTAEYNEIVKKLEDAKKNLTFTDGSLGADEYYNSYDVKTVGEKIYFVPSFNERNVKNALRDYLFGYEQNRLSFIEQATVDGKQTSKFLFGFNDRAYCLDKSKDFALQCSSDCKGWENYALTDLACMRSYYYVWVDSEQKIVKYELAIDKMLETVEEDTTGYFDFYYNVNTKKVQLSTPHKWVQIDYKKATCEENGFMKYRCSVCGEISVRYYGVSHQTYSVFTLKKGSTSCEDGILVTEHCVICDKDAYSYESDYHGMNNYCETVATSDCGAVKIYWGKCACGEESRFGATFLEEVESDDGEKYYEYRWHDVVAGDCLFDRNGDCVESSANKDGKLEYRKYVYTCAVTACAYKYSHEYWFEANGNCTATYYDKFTFGVDDQGNAPANAVTKTFQYAQEYHQNTEDRTYEDSAKDLTVTCVYCKTCGKVVYKGTGYRRDAYGRTLRYWNYETNDGYIYEYDSECRYVKYEMNADGSKGEKDSEGVDHRQKNNTSSWTSPTCTQYGCDKYECAACGTEIKRMYSPKGHDFQKDVDGLYECKKCGMQSENNADGSFVLEDLTDENTHVYKVGFFNRGELEFQLSIRMILRNEDGGEFAPLLNGVDLTNVFQEGTENRSGTITIDMESLYEAVMSYVQANETVVGNATVVGFDVEFTYSYQGSEYCERCTLDVVAFFNWVAVNNGGGDSNVDLAA